MMPPAWLALLLLALTTPLTAAEKQADQQRKLEQLRGRIAELTRTLHLDRDRLDSYQAELRAIERNIARHSIDLRELESQLDSRRQQLQSLQPQERRQRQALRTHQHLLAQQLRSAWLMGEQNRIKMLLNQQDPSRVSRLLKYHEYLNRARSQKVERLGRLQAELAQTRDQLDRERRDIAELHQQTQQRRQQLEQDKQERSTLLNKLAGEIRSKDKELVLLKQNEANLKQLISQLQKTLQELAVEQSQQTLFADFKGRMHWPLKGRLGANFGSPRAGGIVWDGVFIHANEGSEVKAIQSGRVAFADWLRGYGLLLIIDHGEGYMSLYGQNQTLYKKVGDSVRQSEAVAQSGGASPKGQGIYFGIRHRGKPIDPAKWCR